MPDSKGSHDEHVLHESAKQAQTTIKATQGGSSVSQTKKFMSLENMPVSNTVTKDGAEKESVEMCSYWQLFSAADRLDFVLMVVGLIGAIGGGIMMPLFSVVFGDFINAFGDPATPDFMDIVANIALKFTYLAIGVFFAMYLEVVSAKQR